MYVVTAQFDMQRGIDDYMETRMWRSCAGYLERIGSILGDGKDGWVIGPMTGEDEELVNDLMMSTMLGSKSGKGKMTKVAGGGGIEGAMSAMSAEEKLINPHTVSSCPSSSSFFCERSIVIAHTEFILCFFRAKLKRRINGWSAYAWNGNRKCRRRSCLPSASPVPSPSSFPGSMKSTTNRYSEFPPIPSIMS
jgi:hypothetical protein